MGEHHLFREEQDDSARGNGKSGVWGDAGQCVFPSRTWRRISTDDVLPIAVMGPSGAGKSTILDIISKRIAATSGSVSYPSVIGGAALPECWFIVLGYGERRQRRGHEHIGILRRTERRFARSADRARDHPICCTAEVLLSSLLHF